MAVGRYKESVNIVSENHTDFVRWLFLSVAIHLIPALVAVLLPTPPKKVFYSPVYEVTLLTSPEIVKPQDASKEEIPQKEDVPPHERPKVEPKEEPKLKVEVKDIKHKAKTIKHKAINKKSRKEVAVPKPKEDAARPDEAVAKMREKIAAEEAVEGTVEKIRKKVREKEAVSGNSVKIAARPPARVHSYEELDAELKTYVDKIRQTIREAWSLPDVLKNRGFKTTLSIHVHRNGTIESLWIGEGSGNKFYDESTLRAINKVTPLPPLPNGWKEDTIDLEVIF